MIRQQVLNGFIFNGKQVIKPEMLADTNTSSYYKANGEIHGQDRDVAKLLTIDKTKVIISLVGIENQTRPDKYMPARVMNYDAAAYRYQLTKRKTLYPVLTLVVYYGKEAWSYNRNLLGNIKELGKRNKNEVTTMTEVLPEFMQVKIDRARKETTEKVTKDYLINILSTTNLTLDGAMDLLGIPKDDRPMYKDLLKKK